MTPHKIPRVGKFIQTERLEVTRSGGRREWELLLNGCNVSGVIKERWKQKWLKKK